MDILKTRFSSRSEVLERYLPSFSFGGLFVPTRRMLAPGKTIILDIRMPELRDALLVRGEVAWARRGKRSQGIRAGLGVKFCMTERRKRDYLLSLAHGEENQAKARRHKRLPVRLAASWRVPRHNELHKGTIGDIGSGGAFLYTSTVLPQGSPIVLELQPPGSTRTQSIEGKIAWTRKSPGDTGCGIEFRCRDMAGKHRLRELVRRIELNPA